MNSWEIIYEYCSDHPNCTNAHCQKTVVIHGIVGVPSINLFSGKSLVTDRKLGSVRIFGARQATLFKSLLRSIPCMTMLKNAHTPRFITRPTEIFAHKAILKKGHLTARSYKRVTKRTSPRFFTSFSHLLTNDYVIAPARLFGFMLLAIGIGGIVGPFIPQIRMESGYVANQAQIVFATTFEPKPVLPKSAPVVFEPLVDANGAIITPINEDFSIVIPKIGVNAPVIANVDPAKPALYDSSAPSGRSSGGDIVSP